MEIYIQESWSGRIVRYMYAVSSAAFIAMPFGLIAASMISRTPYPLIAIPLFLIATKYFGKVSRLVWISQEAIKLEAWMQSVVIRSSDLEFVEKLTIAGFSPILVHTRLRGILGDKIYLVVNNPNYDLPSMLSKISSRVSDVMNARE